MRLGISVARPNLVSIGTCFGKFTKSGKFKLHVTALDYLAQYAKYKVSIVFLHRSLLPVTGHVGLDQAEWRNAVPLWQPRSQSPPGSNNRRYSRASGCRGVQHERHTISTDIFLLPCRQLTFRRDSA